MSSVLGDDLYVMGGWDGNNYLNHLEVYDTRAARWRSAQHLSAPRAYGAPAVINGHIYLIGGLSGTVGCLSFPCADVPQPCS